MPVGRTTWNETTRAFRDETGRLISRTRVRASLDRYLDNLTAEVGLLTSRLVDGEIDIGTWQDGMADAIKRGHVTASAIAVGGRHQLSQKDLGKAGAEIRYQYGRLNRFARQLEAGRPLNNGTIARAQMYALAPTKTYESILRRDDLKAGYDLEKRHLHAVESCKQCRHYARPGPIKPGNWHKAGSLPSIGEKSSCLSRCRCTFERRRSGKKPNKVKPKPKPIVPPKPKPIKPEPEIKPPKPKPVRKPRPVKVEPPREPERPPEPPRPAPAQAVADDPQARLKTAREAQREANAKTPVHGIFGDEYKKLRRKFPDLIPPGKIEDRLRSYTLGDAKVKEIVAIGDRYDVLARVHEDARNDYNRQLIKLSTDQQRLVGPYVAVNKEPPSHIKEKAGKIKAEFDAISKKRDEAKDLAEQVHRAKAKEVIGILKTDDPADIWQSKFDFSKLTPNGKAKYGAFEPVDDRTWVQVDEAVSYLKKITARGDVSTTSPMIAMKERQRAHMNDTQNVMAVSQNERVETVVHEYGHAFDADFKTGFLGVVGERSKEFMHYRVGNEPFRPMRDFGTHFDEDEQGRKDKFDQALSELQAYYAGKEYPGPRSEVLALGVQALYNDPVAFARKDPEYAKFVIGILDGSLR